MSRGEISNFYEHKSTSPAKKLVIFLHGLGSNGQDLISLAPYFAQKLPDTLFVSPDAPFACDMMPPGTPNSFQWFSLQSRDPHEMLKGVETAAPILDSFITVQAEKNDIPFDKVALVGFSQGTMMSLHVAPRYPEPLAGVVGYSGAMVAKPEGNKMPIHLVHGEADDVVPVSAYNHARGALIGAGFKVSGHTTSGLAHSIDDAGIETGVEFLKDILSL